MSSFGPYRDGLGLVEKHLRDSFSCLEAFYEDDSVASPEDSVIQ